MNETLSSSIWPSFQNSRPNWNEQFSTNSLNTWQNNNSASSEYYQTPVDFNNVWSAKVEMNGEGDKDSYIKSIWSTSTSPNHVPGESNIVINEIIPKHVDITPTNSPSLNRSEIVVSNERWGNIKINQTTPWVVSEIDDSEKRAVDPMVWRAKIDGTEVWEEYYTKQHGKRRPQPADNSFSNENVWSSSTSDISSQSTNSLWANNKSNELISINSSSGGVQNDIFGQNFFGNGGNNHSNFNNSVNNGVRPSMTRNQAQKYLQEMGFSLSDSIGALVNNQMDLPKALNELQSKYRMTTNGSNISNNLCNQFNRPTDNGNISRIPPSGTQINPIVGQNTSSTISSLMNSNFSNNIDNMFHSEIQDQILEPKYMMNIDQNMTAFNRMPETSRQQPMNMARQESYRNNYSNSRSMSTNSGHFSNQDINLLNQNMSRVNFNAAPNNMMNQNSSYNIRPNNNNNNSNGFNGMHNITNNNTNNTNLMLNNSNSNNNNSNMDVRQNFAGMPNVFGRSISKPPIFPINNTGINWHTDPPVMSPNGAIPDMSQLRLAKNMSCPAMPDKVIAIVIKKVQHKHIDFIKTICMESGAMLNFQLNPQAQSIIVQFTNIQDAYRCINIVQNQLSLRVEQINSQDEYMHYMSGAN